MSGTQASIAAASRLLKFRNSSLQNLIRSHLIPSTATTASGVVSQLRRPLLAEIPKHPIQQKTDLNRVGLMDYVKNNERFFARGDKINIGDDDEMFDEDEDESDYEDEDGSDFDEECIDEELDEEEDEDEVATSRYKKKKRN